MAAPRKTERKTTRRQPTAGKSAKGKKPAASAEELLRFYRDMLLIRRFEEKAGQLYGMGLIGGFCHLYIGEEAVAVGMLANRIEGDQVVTSYRDHGHMLACGMDPRRVMAELTGRIDGYSKGKGGSMHMFAREANFFGGHGIVGAPAPIGAGIGFANRYRGTKNVSFTFFGEGAANQGQVHETFNMSALWKLPVVFTIENNRYAMGTAEERSTSTKELYRRGEAFGIPGEQVDGMNVLAVREAGARAAAHCRAGKGPYLIEAMTYRYRGHSMSDPAKYRTREEVQKVREERDPIDGLRKVILEAGVSDEEALKKIDREIRETVNEAARFAQESPEPDPSELWTDVLVEA